MKSRNSRLALRLWCPRPEARPAVRDGAGPLDAVRLSPLTRFSEPDATRPDQAPGASPPGADTRAGRPRMSEFLRRRLPSLRWLEGAQA